MLPEITEMLANAGIAIPEPMVRDWWQQTKGKPRTTEAKKRTASALRKNMGKLKGTDRRKAKEILRHCEGKKGKRS